MEHKTIQTIGLVVKEASSAAQALVKQIESWCNANSKKLIFEKNSAVTLGIEREALQLNQLGQCAEVLVVLGGDGTLLGVARVTSDHAPYLIGVNFGTLGFLTEIAPDETIRTLDKLNSNQAKIVIRHLLQGVCFRNEQKVFDSDAVNDLVIQKSTGSRLMDLNVFVDDQELMSIRGDGLIFSTPAGSTAYSLAAGGSIVHPQLNLTLITPICPHSLTNRPIILPGTVDISVYLPNYTGSAFLTADGQAAFSIKSGDEIKITQSKHSILLVQSESHSYFSRLRSKLNWAIPNRGD